MGASARKEWQRRAFEVMKESVKDTGAKDRTCFVKK